MEKEDNFVVLHRPCKVRLVSSFEIRDPRKSYVSIGPSEMRLMLELDFRLEGETGEERLQSRETTVCSIATD